MRPMNAKTRKVEHLVAKFSNEHRVQRGLERLDTDWVLTSPARKHSRDTARRAYCHRDSGHPGRGVTQLTGKEAASVIGFGNGRTRAAGGFVGREPGV